MKPTLKPVEVIEALAKYAPDQRITFWRYTRTVANSYKFHDPGRMTVWSKPR